MVDRLPDPRVPFADKDLARLRSDFDHTALERLLALLPPGFRGVLYELACTEPDHEAVLFTLAQTAEESDDHVSSSATDPADLFPPQLEDFHFHDPAMQALLEATVAPAQREIVRRLWHEHLAAGFPPGCRGVEVDGVDLVLLDADIAGCVVTFLESGTLDLNRRRILQACATDANRILPRLAVDAKAYFQRAEWLAGFVLAHVGSDESAA